VSPGAIAHKEAQMRLVKLIAAAALSLPAFAAFGASVAGAEADKEPPKLLCLVAKCVEENTATLKGGVSRITTLGGKELEGTEVTTTIATKTCTDPTNEAKDCTLWKDIPIVFKGWLATGTTSKCKTEGSKQAGEVEALLDLHMAAEKATSGELQPLLLMKILNKELKAGLIITCGVLKEELKGTMGCLLIGLANVTAESLACEFNATTHDPITGECELLCEQLKEDPFLANLGAGAEDDWMKIKLEGSFAKDVFIDD
jgi:hypothetical protein